MKKNKFISLVVAMFLVFSMLFAISACEFGGNGGGNGGDNPTPPTHTHNWSTKYTTDENYHWFTCSGCDGVNEKSEHKYTDGVCVCGRKKPVVQGVQYSLSEDGTYAICNGYNTGANIDKIVQIASEYKGVPVKQIADSAFLSDVGMEKVIIPNSVEIIGEYAFQKCSTLKEVEIPEGVKEIKYCAFSKTGITDIVIPNSVQIMGQYVFWDCNKLVNATMYCPQIVKYTFHTCPNLTNVTFGDGVQSIAAYSVNKSENVETIHIASSVTTIENYCVYDIKGTEVYCEASSKPSGWGNYFVSTSVNYIIWDCLNTNKSDYEFARIDGLKYQFKDGKAEVAMQRKKLAGDIVLPESVTYNGQNYPVSNIHAYAFQDCSGITSVEMPDSIEEIGDYAFRYCNLITEITLPNIITQLNKYVFADCSALENVVLPDTLTTLMGDAFYNCTSLKEFVLTENITTISGSPFSSCSNLILKTPLMDDPKGWGYSFDSGVDLYIWDCENAAFINGVVYRIENGEAIAFEVKRSITGSLSIESVVEIGGTNYAVTQIATDFSYRRGTVKELVIPSSIQTIGETAFYNITSLQSVVINGGNIGLSAFNQCTNLQTVTLNGNISSIGKNAFYKCENLKNLTFCNSIESIGESAFYWCLNLEEIVLPNSVTTIGKQAFDFCKSLKSITIPSSVTTIGERAIYGATSVVYCEAKSKPAGWYNNWWTLGDTAISADNDNTIIVWDCNNNTLDEFGNIIVTEDGVKYALKNGTAVVKRNSVSISGEIVIKDSIDYGSKSYSVTRIIDRAFYECDKMTSIVIPEGVTTIGNYAFYGCTSLASASLPDTAVNIGRNTFESCNKLKEIRLPANITTLTEAMFNGCYEFTEFVVPSTVTTIEYKALGGCLYMTSVYIPATVTTINNSAFYNSYDLVIYCEASSKPSGWVDKWNVEFSYNQTEPKETFLPVVWDYKNNEIATDGKIYKTIDNVRYSLIDGEAVVEKQNKFVEGSVEIPKTVTYKGVTYNVGSMINAAFKNCYNLTSVTIGEGITTISEEAFRGCNNLTQVTLHKNIVEIAKNAFTDISQIVTFNYNGTMAEWKAIKRNGLPSKYKVICTDGTL